MLHTVKIQPLCSCGKQLKFLKLNRGFYKTCGNTECVSNIRSVNSTESSKHIDWKKSIAKAKETNIARYGGETSLCKSSSLYTKRVETMKSKYGVEYALQNKELSQKQQDTTLSRHGTLNMFSLDKVSDTMIEKYGHAHYKQNSELAMISAAKSAITKGNKLVDRIVKMNLNILASDAKIFDLQCKKCGSKITNLRRSILNDCYIHHVTPCYKCFPINRFRSKLEEEVANEVRNIYTNEITFNKKTLGTEVDIHIVDKKLCIEFNGIYWHSEFYKPPKFHINKKINVEKNGQELLQVWEDDWVISYKRKIIMSLIKRKLNITQLIPLSDCIIREVSSEETRAFLYFHDLKPYLNSDIKIGLYYNNTLVELLTFEKNKSISDSISYMIVKHTKHTDFEIFNGLNNIMLYFVENYKCNNISILVDCDCHPFKDSIYEKNGFSKNSLVDSDLLWNVKGERMTVNDYCITHSCIVDKMIDENTFMRNKGFYTVEHSGWMLFKWKS